MHTNNTMSSICQSQWRWQ